MQVDKDGLRRLTVEALGAGLQSRTGNTIAGLEGRSSLLIRLGAALDEKKEFFGDDGRPRQALPPLLAAHAAAIRLARQSLRSPALAALPRDRMLALCDVACTADGWPAREGVDHVLSDACRRDPPHRRHLQPSCPMTAVLLHHAVTLIALSLAITRGCTADMSHMR